MPHSSQFCIKKRPYSMKERLWTSFPSQIHHCPQGIFVLASYSARPTITYDILLVGFTREYAMELFPHLDRQVVLEIKHSLFPMSVATFRCCKIIDIHINIFISNTSLSINLVENLVAVSATTRKQENNPQWNIRYQCIRPKKRNCLFPVVVWKK